MLKPALPALALFAIAFFGLTADAQTCPGSSGCLDLTFGTGGVVLTNINLNTGGGWAPAAALQSDGKIVVAAQSPNYPAQTGYDFYVLRYDEYGALDATFGSGGVARIAFTSAVDNELPYAIAIQPDSRIVVTGTVPTGAAVARINSDGTLDSSFGAGGKVVFKYSGKESATIADIAIQPNGRIVVAGNSDNKFAFARLTTSGTFDTSFNGSGKFTLQAASGNNPGGVNALVLQADGKIVGVGTRPDFRQNTPDFAVLRLDSNGTLDPTFGTAGQVYTDFSNLGFPQTIRDVARGVKIDALGRILVAGNSLLQNPTEERLSFARYLANGQLDTSFGSGGRVMQGALGTHSRMNGRLVIQTDEKFVVSGQYVLPGSVAELAVFRFLSDGSVDTGFGVNGIATRDTTARRGMGASLLLQPDGKLVVTGSGDGEILVARFLP